MFGEDIMTQKGKTGSELHYDSDMRIFEMQLKAVGSLVRIKILRSVSNGPKSVLDISQEVGLSQPSSSSQVNILWSAGFLFKSKQGKYVYYELDRPAFKRFQQGLIKYLKLK